MNLSVIFPTKLILFLLLTCIGSSSAAALDQKEQEQKLICETSISCKKVCELGLIDKLEFIPPEQQKLVLRCTQDMLDRVQATQKK